LQIEGKSFVDTVTTRKRYMNVGLYTVQYRY
jgi:hypothetical protein